MKGNSIGKGVMAAGLLVTFGAGTAAAQVPDAPPEQQTLGEGAPASTLPAPRSDNDPQPPVAAPTVPVTGVTKQAGVGGTQAYGRAGVLELGGSAGFSAADNYARYELSPSIGLFVLDNVQLSLITAFNHIRLGDTDTSDGDNLTELRALVEPSFHLPLSQTVFGFLGLGAGVSYLTGSDAGFALQPRIGANFLVGRSGVLTPAFNVAYSTVESLRTPEGTRLLGINTSYGLNVGYTVMW